MCTKKQKFRDITFNYLSREYSRRYLKFWWKNFLKKYDVTDKFEG